MRTSVRDYSYDQKETIKGFFSEMEWDAIYSALAEFQDHGDEESDIASSINHRIYELFKSEIKVDDYAEGGVVRWPHKGLGARPKSFFKLRPKPLLKLSYETPIRGFFMCIIATWMILNSTSFIPNLLRRDTHAASAAFCPLTSTCQTGTLQSILALRSKNIRTVFTNSWMDYERFFRIHWLRLVILRIRRRSLSYHGID